MLHRPMECRERGHVISKEHPASGGAAFSFRLGLGLTLTLTLTLFAMCYHFENIVLIK